MSATALTSIQEIIERTLFEAIRQEVVDKEYLPDVSDIGTYPDTEAGWTAWEAAINTVVSTKGFAIEVFGGGSNEAKGTKKVPRIVIECGNFLLGDLGGDPRRFFVDKTTHFQALVTPPQTVNFFVNFHLISNTVEQTRILNAIMALAVPRRHYHPWYNDTTKTFFAEYLNYYDQSNVDKGITEYVYGYKVPDAWDHEDIEIYETVAKMTEITLNTNVQKYMDRTWGHDSTPLIVTP